MLVNLSKDEMSTILYVLGDYVQDNDNEYMVGQINPISRKFEGIIDACECQSQKQQEEIQ